MSEDLKRAEIISQTKLPQEAKAIGVMGALMGVPTDSIIKGMGSVINSIETQKAEESNPIPNQPTNYSKTERVIADMLQESTGTHFLDSGGAFGRAWQRNRMITDFRQTKPVSAEVWSNGELSISINIFHYLTTFLDRDSRSEDLEKRFYQFLESDSDLGYYDGMEKFAEKLRDEGEFTEPSNGFNSYNGETLLSQVIQGVWLGNSEYPDYVILQIHNGADVRGGYTKPRFFRVTEFDYMAMAESDISASCKCCNASSDDCGYHWYVDGSSAKNEFQDDSKLPRTWVAKQDRKNAKNWQYHLVCNKCKTPVRFSSIVEGY